ncbi:hypothetical protein KRX56_06085 [Dermabacteraceae bacterium TAE3-ERU27]|nr:hypothetical protein [Dermabacteraceae bacterium TAE3-ERU27]
MSRGGIFEFDNGTPEEAAAAAIRAYCGWHVAPVLTETLTLDGNGTDTILLPSRQVCDIHTVTVNGQALSADCYEWSAAGMLRRIGGVWPERFRCLEVTLRHGFEDAVEVAGIVEAYAARVRMDTSGAVSSQRAGTQYVSFGSGGGGLGLMAKEREILAPYRLNWGP